MTMSTDQQPPQLAKPLLGKKILITRPREQAGHFATLLREYGAEPVEMPTIQIAPASSLEALDRAIAEIRTYDWLIFTSVNGVMAFFARFDAQGRPIADLKGLKVCAIGPVTANELQARGLEVDVMPSEYRAEAVVESLSTFPIAGSRILVPRAAVARDVLPRALEARGAHVDVVEVYRTTLPAIGLAVEMRRLLEQGTVAVVTFTSPSTVINFVSLVGEMNLSSLLREIVVACIGPVTAETARSYALTPTIVPHEYTIPALTRAIVDYYEGIEKTVLRTEC
jgi:uroporphyrinogen III methyltransferase/synthase